MYIYILQVYRYSCVRVFVINICIYVRNINADTIHTDFRGPPRASYMYKCRVCVPVCVTLSLHEWMHICTCLVCGTPAILSRPIGIWNVRMADRRWRIKPVSPSHCSTLGRSGENMKNLSVCLVSSTAR